MAQPAPITNRLLDRLPGAERARTLAHCEHVELAVPASLAQPGVAIRDVYFPAGSCISLLMPIEPRSTLEVALAGSEGLFGLPVALGMSLSPVHAQVQASGPAWRMDAADFRRELRRTPALRDCIDRYIFVSMAQLMRNVACNRFHVVEQRVARWLLMAADRAHASTFHATQDFIAHALGVRRVGVTVAASALQQRRLISYWRGAVSVRDRKGLERASCRCYQDDIAYYRRYLG